MIIVLVVWRLFDDLDSSNFSLVDRKEVKLEWVENIKKKLF